MVTTGRGNAPGTSADTDVQTRAIERLKDLSPPQQFWGNLDMAISYIQQHPDFQGCVVNVDGGTFAVNKKLLSGATGTGGGPGS